MASRLVPLSIQQVGDELAFAWSDGTETFLRIETLRRGCPCAACGGEPDVMGWVDRPEVSYGSDSFDLKRYQTVGGYAIQPTWGDGHGSGLYSYTYLQRLGAMPPPPALEPVTGVEEEPHA